jgi:tetratricopeptide (TPR) repeat protein
MSDVQISIAVNFARTEENTLLARDMLAKAVQLGGNADAAAWLADLTISDYLNCWNGADSGDLENAGNHIAIALANQSPPPALAFYAQGCLHRAYGRHEDAQNAFHQARTADPDFARAFAHEGAELINLGDWESGRQLVDQAIALGCDDSSRGVFYCMKGRAYFFEAAACASPDYTDAIYWLEQSRAKRDNLWYNWAYLIAAYHLGDRTNEASAQLAAFRAKYTTISEPDDITTQFEAHNPDGDCHPSVTQGRKTFLDAIKAIW